MVNKSRKRPVFGFVAHVTRAAKFVLSLTLCCSLALPVSSPVYAQGPDGAADLTPDEIRSISELKTLIAQIEALPDTPASNEQREKALQAAYGLLAESETMMLRISVELENLIDANGKAKRSSDQTRIDELRHHAQVLVVVLNDIARFVGRYGGEYTAFFLADPAGGVTEENLKTARVSLPGQQLTEADKEDATKQKTRLQALATGAGSTAAHFSNQYFAYSSATGLIALAQLQFINVANPNALELWYKQTTDIMGAAGFAMFMAGSHVTIKLLNRITKGHLPKSLLPYLGMTAGFLAQSYFHDLVNDKDVQKCWRPFINSRAKPNPEACQKAKETWIGGQHAKILQYTPALISMLGSTALAGAIRGALVTTGGPQALHKKYTKLVVKGARLFRNSKQALAFAMGLPGIVVTVGDFVLFIALDAYLLHEPVNQAWQNMRMNYFDPRAFIENRVGLHSEVLFPKENTYQLIHNALDVEATNLRTAHGYFMETLERMQKSGWENPPLAKSCMPTTLLEDIRSGKAGQMKDLWFWQRYFERGKSREQLRCEVFSRPGDLIERYSAVNREWRGILLSHYSIGQSNWLSMIDQFSTVYEASYRLAKYLAKKKFELSQTIHKGQASRPDLSRETLAKIIGAPLPNGDPDEERPAQAHETQLRGTVIPTPELVDYVIASFACGREAITEAEAQKENSRILNTFYSVYMRQISSSPFISTPYGSNLRFTPPKLTNRPTSICETLPLDNRLGRGRIQNPFNGLFRDWSDNGKNYRSLAEYIFDNLDPALYRQIGISHSFEVWWSERIREPIAPVWSKYEGWYERFISENFVPVLFDRSFRQGCSPSNQPSSARPDATDEDGFRPPTTSGIPDSTTKTPLRGPQPVEVNCTDASTAYRVANGVFLSQETELRNYLRGLFTIYTTSIAGSPDLKRKKAGFLRLANEMIDRIKSIDEKRLNSNSYDEVLQETETLRNTLIAVVEESIAISRGPNASFRLEMAKKFEEALAKLHGEIRDYASTFHALDFSGGSSARARVKKLNDENGSTGNNRPLSLPGGRHSP